MKLIRKSIFLFIAILVICALTIAILIWKTDTTLALLSGIISLVSCILSYTSSIDNKKSIEKITALNEISINLEKEKIKPATDYYRIHNDTEDNTNNKTLKDDVIKTILKQEFKIILSKIESEDLYIYKHAIINKNLSNTYIRNRILDKKIAENKNETIVNLYLKNEKNIIFHSKLIAVSLMTISIMATLLFDINFLFFLPGGILYCILEIKEKLLTYRVNKGYFGTNASEALVILNFIHENIDDINNHGNGGKRHILNDEVDSTPDSIDLPGEIQHG
ncbi:hypothetical protein [Morganella morganii]|uniref:hypothetical protein n=1 Tax=Morganella morganii TaxID=582 RepID=UPI003B9FDA36